MICPNDGVQMHQYAEIGGGSSDDEKYMTWEIKICPQYHRLVKEFYSVEVITEDDIKNL